MKKRRRNGPKKSIKQRGINSESISYLSNTRQETSAAAAAATTAGGETRRIRGTEKITYSVGGEDCRNSSSPVPPKHLTGQIGSSSSSRTNVPLRPLIEMTTKSVGGEDCPTPRSCPRPPSLLPPKGSSKPQGDGERTRLSPAPAPSSFCSFFGVSVHNRPFSGPPKV